MHKPEQEFYPYGVAAPCKNCPKVGCGPYHTKCEAYQQYKADLEKSKLINKELNADTGYRGAKSLGCHYKPKKWTNKNNPFSI